MRNRLQRALSSSKNEKNDMFGRSESGGGGGEKNGGSLSREGGFDDDDDDVLQRVSQQKS